MKHNIKLLFFIFIIYFSSDSIAQQEANQSSYFTDSIFSNFLSEYRKMNIYLPEKYVSGKSYPVIYATDGMTIGIYDSYKLVLDSLIHFNIIPPVILIQSYSSDKPTKESYSIGSKPDTVYRVYREFDYVESSGFYSSDSLLKQRFSKHLNYFTEEFITSIEKKYSLTNEKTNRYFYGYSNGAGFGLNMMNKKPEIIGTYICFSTLGSSIESLKWSKKVGYPQIFLEYGDKEHSILSEEANVAMKKFKKHKIKSQVTVYNGGHDQNIWPIEFARTLEQIFKK